MPKQFTFSTLLPFVSQSQHASEVKRREEESVSSKSYLSDLISSARSRRNDEEVLSDGSSTKSGPRTRSKAKSKNKAKTRGSPNPKKWKKRVDTWYDRITVEDLEATKAKAKLSKKAITDEKRHARFRKGRVVYTRNRNIADLEKELQPGFTKRRRIPAFGVLLKQSEICKHFWLVKFHRGDAIYCNESILHFGADATPTTHLLGRSDGNMLCLKEVKFEIDKDKETVLKDILMPKILNLPGHDSMSYKEIVALFSQFHPWLTENVLIEYVSAYKKNISFNINDDTKSSNSSSKSSTYGAAVVTPSTSKKDSDCFNSHVGKKPTTTRDEDSDSESEDEYSDSSTGTFFKEKKKRKLSSHQKFKVTADSSQRDIYDELASSSDDDSYVKVDTNMMKRSANEIIALDSDDDTLPPSSNLTRKRAAKASDKALTKESTLYDSSDNDFVHVPEDIGVVNDAITRFVQNSGMRDPRHEVAGLRDLVSITARREERNKRISSIVNTAYSDFINNRYRDVERDEDEEGE